MMTNDELLEEIKITCQSLGGRCNTVELLAIGKGLLIYSINKICSASKTNEFERELGELIEGTIQKDILKKLSILGESWNRQHQQPTCGE